MKTFITVDYEQNTVTTHTNALVEGTDAWYSEMHFLQSATRLRKDIKRLPTWSSILTIYLTSVWFYADQIFIVIQEYFDNSWNYLTLLSYRISQFWFLSRSTALELHFHCFSAADILLKILVWAAVTTFLPRSTPTLPTYPSILFLIYRILDWEPLVASAI